jgi:hypothetical protein
VDSFDQEGKANGVIEEIMGHHLRLAVRDQEMA